MVDFLLVSMRTPKKDVYEIYPKFIVKNHSKDLMIRGNDFYAIWVEDRGLWSTNEQDVIDIIDAELDAYAESVKGKLPEYATVRVLHMWDGDTKMIDKFHSYCKNQMRDSFHMLDEKLIFSNYESNKTDYASKRLNYPLEPGDISAYDRLMSTIYTPEERHKIEWAIGSIVTGDSKEIQKFLVLYGAAGTGKSTILNIIQKLFDGYFAVFDAKALGSGSDTFALEPFRTNPLVAIQHDGDLSRIEDNTRLNSLVSHETMTVNEKFKSTYSNQFKAFLFMGTNKPVRITDAKSGLIRRLIDVTPSGQRLGIREYKSLIKKIDFELGAIACYCRDVYLEDPSYYDSYIPIGMMGASNDFYNFIEDSYFTFKEEDGVSLKTAWEMYKLYCEDARVPYPMTKRVFKEELKNYFSEFNDRYQKDGARVWYYYSGFRSEKFHDEQESVIVEESTSWLDLKVQPSLLDDIFKDSKAQYAVGAKEVPKKSWADVTTTLKDLDTLRAHYVKPDDEQHIFIDFDIKDKTGKKCLAKNLEAAKAFPKTYAELSKGGEGLHLHYIYAGDVSKLSLLYDKDIEVKVCTGGSSIRRRLSMCNDIPVATISSGLPLKGEDYKVVDHNIKSERRLRTLIYRALLKEWGSTTNNVDFIYKLLEEAYNSDLVYDVSDMYDDISRLAEHSTNQRDHCIKTVNKMKMKSKEDKNSATITSDDGNSILIFYDVEVFPNLFLVNWKKRGKENKVVRMINPSPQDIGNLLEYKLIGFNCRRYDNHIMFARWMGYSNEELYELSQRIISGDRSAFFGKAYDLSYTDVYDFSSKKQSLKKFEIELGITHKELGLPWDKPVDESLWEKVAEYCDNDVIATEAVFEARQSDWNARQVLAAIAKSTPNDTTNSLTTKIIFGNNRHPQSEFNYRNMGDISKWNGITLANVDPEYTKFDEKQRPLFPGYTFSNGKSTYRGEEVGEGGYVYSEPGMYGNLALLDISSMHPSSAVEEELFGVQYTGCFADILNARLAIKHGEFDKARNMLGGVFKPYLNDESKAQELAQALKIAINSVYGLTSAKFDNPFRDIRNVDNIVAKRGALFMINLKHEVQNRGYTVAHIKTDSIKIPDADNYIIQFVMDYGKLYGYNFEHEATYERMCLVNDAVYIAKYATKEKCEELYGAEYVNSEKDICKDNKKKGGKWTATGKQFAVPYVYKTLFTKEPIEFEDTCETFAVQKGDLYLDTNENLPDVTEFEKELEKTENLYKKGQLSDISFENICKEKNFAEEIAKGHEYRFVGRVGRFTPVCKGENGGILYRIQNGKNYAAPGSSGYRWLESETVKENNKKIDHGFYIKLVDDARDTISKYGDFEWFVSDDPYISEHVERKIPEYVDETIPF